jgi:hypothetical protein
MAMPTSAEMTDFDADLILVACVVEWPRNPSSIRISPFRATISVSSGSSAFA